MGFVNIHSNVFVAYSEQELEDDLNGATLPATWNVKAKGNRFVWAADDGAGIIISAEAQAVLDRMTGLTATEETAIINFVNEESASLGNGNWAFYDEMFSFGLNGANALIGWIAKTAVNNGAGLSVAGAEVDGAATYIDSNFNPSVDGVNYTQDNAILGAFLNVSETDANFNTLLSIFAQAQINDSDGNAITMTINGGLVSFLEGLASSNLYIGSRGSSSEVSLYKNGAILEAPKAATSSVFPNSVFLIGARSGPQQYLKGTISTAIFGGSVGFNQALHYQNLLTYLIELGTFAQPVIDSFPAALAGGEEARITAYINAEVRAGNWGKYDSFFDFTLTDPANALWDWIRGVSATNNGAVLGVDGATFAGAEWIDSNFTPSIDGVNFSLNDNMLGVFLTAFTSGARQYMAGVNVGSNTKVGDIQADNLSYFHSASGDLLQIVKSPENDSLYTITTNGVTATGYKNGALDGSAAGTPITLATDSIYIGDNNPTAGFLTGTISTFLAGAAIGFDQAAHNTNLRTLIGV